MGGRSWRQRLGRHWRLGRRTWTSHVSSGVISLFFPVLLFAFALSRRRDWLLFRTVSLLSQVNQCLVRYPPFPALQGHLGCICTHTAAPRDQGDGLAQMGTHRSLLATARRSRCMLLPPLHIQAPLQIGEFPRYSQSREYCIISPHCLSVPPSVSGEKNDYVCYVSSAAIVLS